MGYEGFCTPGLSPHWVSKRHTRYRWKNADRTNSALHNLRFRIYRQKKSDKSIWTFSSSPNVDKIFISTTWILCFVYAESE